MEQFEGNYLGETPVWLERNGTTDLLDSSPHKMGVIILKGNIIIYAIESHEDERRPYCLLLAYRLAP